MANGEAGGIAVARTHTHTLSLSPSFTHSLTHSHTDARAGGGSQVSMKSVVGGVVRHAGIGGGCGVATVWGPREGATQWRAAT